MNYNLFAKNLAKLSFNFSNLIITEGYIKFMFQELKDAGFNDQDLLQSLNAIINNEKALFNLPSKALFLEYSNKKPLTHEKLASVEADRIIEAAKLNSTVLFDNEITNAAVMKYGGIGKIYHDLFDIFNKDLKQQVWVKKELKEIWLNCESINDKSCNPSYIKGHFAKDIHFIGNQQKCSQLITQHNLLIENNTKPIGKCLSIGELIKS